MFPHSGIEHVISYLRYHGRRSQGDRGGIPSTFSEKINRSQFKSLVSPLPHLQKCSDVTGQYRVTEEGIVEDSFAQCQQLSGKIKEPILYNLYISHVMFAQVTSPFFFT